MEVHIWDIFISHASEDKDLVARPLANLLAGTGLKVWLDEGELFVGDSLREKIDAGLSKSKFGIVILSANFFAKDWTSSELDGLLSREINGTKVVLPVWHELDFEHIKKHSPILAGRVGVKTSLGLNEVKKQLVNAIEKSHRGHRLDQPLFAGRLTKKVLMTLPEGSILMSNIVNSDDYSPKFVEELSSVPTRQKLWKRLKDLEVSGSKFYAFSSWLSYRTHLASRATWTPVRSPLL